MQTWLLAASCAEDGALDLFFLAVLGALVVAGGVDDEEGTGGEVGPGLFRVRMAVALPLSKTAFTPLLAPLARGHQCLLVALQDVNLHPHASHCCWGWPSMASSANLWQSCLDMQFLLHARHFFSFWAVVAHLSPFNRSKKA
jgi:hypothetical protein